MWKPPIRRHDTERGLRSQALRLAYHIPSCAGRDGQAGSRSTSASQTFVINSKCIPGETFRTLALFLSRGGRLRLWLWRYLGECFLFQLFLHLKVRFAVFVDAFLSRFQDRRVEIELTGERRYQLRRDILSATDFAKFIGVSPGNRARSDAVEGNKKQEELPKRALADASEITGLPRDNFEVWEITREEFERRSH
jgi:hypothetical protein